MAGLGGLTGCSDYLDSDYLFDERMSIEDVFTNKDYTNRWLAQGYAYLGDNALQDICSKRTLPFNFADDMYLQSPNQKIPDRKTKCVIKTHINIKQNVIFGAKLKPV